MQLTSQQRDLLIRTIIGEAASEPFAGQQAVANVILNRANSGRYGNSVADVILAPNQFEPWSTRKNELLAIPQTSNTYQTAALALDAALKGDQTGGATHFFSREVMNDRGGAPDWYTRTQGNGSWRDIGGHVFGQADGQGTMRDDRGTAWNSGYGQAAPSGLLDAEPYTQTADLPPEPDWEALKAMGDAITKKKKQGDEAAAQQPIPQPFVLQPLRRIKLGGGLLG